MENGKSPSWAWLSGILFMLTLTFGGYAWSSINSRILTAEIKTETLNVETAKHEVYQQEIIRRLTRIETIVERLDRDGRLVESRPPGKADRARSFSSQ